MHQGEVWKQCTKNKMRNLEYWVLEVKSGGGLKRNTTAQN